MTTLRIPTPLQPYTLGNQMVIVKGKTVGEAMADLVVQYPSIKQHLFNDSDELRPFVNIFLGEEEIRRALTGMENGIGCSSIIFSLKGVPPL